MLRRIWLVFAQACTVCLAALFVVTTLRPDLLARSERQVRPGRAAAGNVDAGEHAEDRDGFRRGEKGDAGGRRHLHEQGDCASARRSSTIRWSAAISPTSRSGCRKQRATSLGSGVIVSAEGYVLTNNHVIDGADDIQIVLADGRRMGARVRGTDPESDLAVLKADGDNFPAITFGALERVQVGDFVLAIGNPFGFGNTVTLGIVSALGRNHLGINRFEDFIQTDAAINLGNSGGALVDTAGNLIGINSTIFSQIRRLARHRVRDPGVDRAKRARADHQGRRRDARLAGTRAAGPHRRRREGARARERRLACRSAAS